jgi:hypothetical protein
MATPDARRRHAGSALRSAPGGIELSCQLGGAAGYFPYVARVPAREVTMAALLNSDDDLSPLLLPAATVLAAAQR